MLRKPFSALLLLLSISMLYRVTPIAAHDAFYPHHREDFENMGRRRELRVTVLISTVVFLAVLGVVVYLALRKSRDNRDIADAAAKMVQERLEQATHNAARAVLQSLDANGNVAEATTVCFSTYSESCGVTWHPRLDDPHRAESVVYQIRCKIGADVVTLSITPKSVQIRAEHDSSNSENARATVVLNRADSESG